jgi:hypothetical protein
MIVFYAVGRGDPTWAIVFGVVAVVARAISAIRGQNAAGKTLEELQALSPDKFEEWTSARFRDHGVDIIDERAGEPAIVQCKRFKA